MGSNVTNLAASHGLIARIEKLRKKDEKVTLSLRLDGELHKTALLLAKRTNARSVQQAIREAIAIYDVLLSEADKGKDVFIVDSKTNEKYPLFETQSV